MSDFMYYINDEGLKIWEDWMADGYLRRLRATEQMTLNIALLPVMVFLGFLMAAWIPGSTYYSTPMMWCFGWGYLVISVAMLTWYHLKHPRSLKDEAREETHKSIERMIYHARLHSEIKQMTEDE